MRRAHAAAAAAVLLAVSAGARAGQQEGRISSYMSAGGGITSVPGIKVGQVTLTERPTGCTVILAESGAVGGVDIRGSAPGTIETDLLNPVNLVQQVHAVFLSGGSAFGLDVAAGVRKYLYERKIGFETRAANVPIVPGAILYDLGVGSRPDIWPTADCGYRAAADASYRRRRRRKRRCWRWCDDRQDGRRGRHERRTGYGIHLGPRRCRHAHRGGDCRSQCCG